MAALVHDYGVGTYVHAPVRSRIQSIGCIDSLAALACIALADTNHDAAPCGFPTSLLPLSKAVARRLSMHCLQCLTADTACPLRSFSIRNKIPARLLRSFASLILHFLFFLPLCFHPPCGQKSVISSAVRLDTYFPSFSSYCLCPILPVDRCITLPTLVVPYTTFHILDLADFSGFDTKKPPPSIPFSTHACIRACTPTLIRRFIHPRLLAIRVTGGHHSSQGTNTSPTRLPPLSRLHTCQPSTRIGLHRGGRSGIRDYTKEEKDKKRRPLIDE